MLRLPRLRYLRPRTVGDAVAAATELGARGAYVAGGTDLYPNLKRRQFPLDTLIGLSQLPALADISSGGDGIHVGANVTLAAAAADPRLRAAHPGYADAAGLVSSPPLRNQGTIGGNLCVDTRCNYYNMTYEWRKSIGFCMKRDGDICLVAPSSPRCWAVSSSDTAPMAIAVGAQAVLNGADGERLLPVAALYADDGIEYMAKRPEELVTTLILPPGDGVRSAYIKLRRRGSIDFPIAGAAVAMRLEGDIIQSCSIVLSAVASHPVEAIAAGEFLAGRELSSETISEAAELAARPAKPLDNADLTHFWRKRMVRVVVEQALQRAATTNRT